MSSLDRVSFVMGQAAAYLRREVANYKFLETEVVGIGECCGSFVALASAGFFMCERDPKKRLNIEPSSLVALSALLMTKGLIKLARPLTLYAAYCYISSSSNKHS